VLGLIAVALPAHSAAGQESVAALASVVQDTSLAPARAGDFPSPDRFDEDTVAFVARVNAWLIRYRVMAIRALPGDEITIEVAGGEANQYRLRFAEGTARAAEAPANWTWTAPDRAGTFAVRIERSDGSSAIHLNVLVMVPRSEVKNGYLNGYPIGSYRAQAFRGLPRYLPPRGFAEVWAADEDILASPHFTIGQFLCKEPGEPRYVVLSTFLLLKLEAALRAANQAGFATQSFNIMSGFRTPAYNRAIGNRTSYSRHLWGDAADIYIDTDGDGIIDDLNGDGRSDIEDARVLARVVDGMARQAPPGVIPGGLSVYRANPAHGPFVHVDTRGYRARW